MTVLIIVTFARLDRRVPDPVRHLRARRERRPAAGLVPADRLAAGLRRARRRLLPRAGQRPLRPPGPGNGPRPAVRRGQALRRGRRVHVRARDRRLHDDGARDRRPRRGDRQARLRRAGTAVARDRRRDGAVLAARNHDGLGGRDARLLRPPDTAHARAGLRPDGGGGHDHRERDGRRDGIDREPVLHRRRQRVRRRRDRRRHRAALDRLVRAYLDHDRVRRPLRRARQGPARSLPRGLHGRGQELVKKEASGLGPCDRPPEARARDHHVQLRAPRLLGHPVGLDHRLRVDRPDHPRDGRQRLLVEPRLVVPRIDRAVPGLSRCRRAGRRLQREADHRDTSVAASATSSEPASPSCLRAASR